MNNNNDVEVFLMFISSNLKFGWLLFFFKQVLRLTMECLVVVIMERKTPVKSVDAFMRFFS